MAEVTGMTASAMQAIADASVVSGEVNGAGHLILETSGGGTSDAGNVVGPTGATGAQGPTGATGIAPTGAVIMWASATLPGGGWIVCNGQAISRTTYANLFALLGTKYGAGDGSTTFQVPSMSGRFPRMDPSYGTNLGVTGGSDTHAHQIDGGTPSAIAHISTAATAAPNLYMERLDSQPSWTPSIGAGVTNSSTPGAVTSGAKVTGETSSASSDPPFINLIFLIKD